MTTATLDTCVWIDYLRKTTATRDPIHHILTSHAAGIVQVYASSRVRDPDTSRHPRQWEELGACLEAWEIAIDGAPFRMNISRPSGPDRLSGRATQRSREELRRFRELVGQDPTSLHGSQRGRRSRSKIADYDALRTHFVLGRDVFVTLDRHDYFAIAKRERYEGELGLLIRSPHEFAALLDKPL